MNQSASAHGKTTDVDLWVSEKTVCLRIGDMRLFMSDVENVLAFLRSVADRVEEQVDSSAGLCLTGGDRS